MSTTSSPKRLGRPRIYTPEEYKIRRRLLQKEFRAKHKERLREAYREWYAENREYALTRSRLYYQENHAKIRMKRNASHRRYIAANRQAIKLSRALRISIPKARTLLEQEAQRKAGPQGNHKPEGEA